MPKISVITPFHNVELNVFRNGFDSMINQTVGIENIEWIIVLHNCEQEYIDGVKELTKGYDTIITPVLNNSAHTPSSPRNYGIKMETGDYIGFLDGDDSYLPDCLETTLKHIMSTSSDICCFRREFELENEGQLPINEIVLWDQTREVIVENKDTWNPEKIFVSVWGMVTSKIYSREFLVKHALVFDEEIPFSEDAAFNMGAYMLAENVCFLPQYIGYHYYINSASLVQNSKKDAETLITYAKSMVKIFEKGLAAGCYMNNMIGGLLYHISRFLSAGSYDVETRTIIRDILKPYLDIVEPFKVCKLYTEDDVKLRYDFPKSVLMNVSYDADKDVPDRLPYPYSGTLSGQAGVLSKILAACKDTDYGKRCGFDSISRISEFRENVPLTDYDTYYPMFKLIEKIGESGIFCPEKIRYLAVSYSLSGKLKKTPVSYSNITRGVKMLSGILKGKSSLVLLQHKMQLDGPFKEIATDTIFGHIISEYLSLSAKGYNKDDVFISPMQTGYLKELENVIYAKALFALKYRELDLIIASDSAFMDMLCSVLKKHHEQLISDIANGTLTLPAGEEDASLSEKIKNLNSSDIKRAEELKNIFKDGFADDIFKKIWHGLEKIICMSTGDYQVYTDKLKSHLGDVCIENGYLYNETGIYTRYSKDDIFEMDMSAGFYEWKSLNADDSGKVYLSDELKDGQKYELIVTNDTGLYRYKTGVIVEVVDCKKDSLRIKYIESEQ